MIASYRELRARRPELAQGEVILNVAEELRLAKRTDDLEKFYRETIESATQVGQIAGALDLAGTRGDVSALIQLSERYDRLQTGRSTPAYTTLSYTFNPGLALCQGLNVCAGRKDYSQVEKLVDFSLEAAKRKREQQSKGAAAQALRARVAALVGAGVQLRSRILVGSRYISVLIGYPQANEYFDGSVIQVLRTAFELYKRDDLSSDLVNHFRRQAAAARTPADAVYPRLALSAILWWSDQKDEAIAELTSVVNSDRPESELRIDLAELLMQQGAPSDAIELLDAVQPMDNMSLKRREELAIAAAISAGNSERAQHAAERLFGLRLDTDTQIRLAGQMHGLGLHELAGAMLGRARRRAGGQSSALVDLMTQFQRQGKLEQAAQIAMQVLRASRNSFVPTSRSALDPDTARPAAMRVLAASGRLPQLIERSARAAQDHPELGGDSPDACRLLHRSSPA